MYSLNRATIIGNATRDPELRTTPNGKSVTGFAVATNRRWTDRESGETKEEVQFHEIVAWGKLAEIISQYLHKGNKVYIEGRLQTRTWEGQDGAKREKTEIVADDFVFLTPKGQSSSSSDTTGANTVDEPKETVSKPAEEKKTEKPAEKTDPARSASSTADAGGEDEINLDEIPF